jgi:hypothetical protein
MKLSNSEKISTACIFMMTAVFSLLNFCKIITLPWIWVLSPVWVPMGIYVVGNALLLVFRKILNTCKEFDEED